MHQKNPKDILYKKLGLGGAITQSKKDSIVDDDKSTHKIIKDYKIDIINRGTLKNFQPSLALRKIHHRPNDDVITYETFEVPLHRNGYDSEVKTKILIKNQLSFAYFNKYNIDITDNDFYSEAERIVSNNHEKVNYTIPGLGPGLSYVRLNYSGLTNTNNLDGFTYKNFEYTNFNFSNDTFTGKKSAALNKNFRTWDPTLTSSSGTSSSSTTQNFSGFYIPYPSTIDSIKYNAYGIPIKIAHESWSDENLNGLIMISTGAGLNERVCYISPHGLKTGLSNTLVYNRRTFKDKKTQETRYIKTVSGIVAKTLILGSQYSESKAFPRNKGIRYKESGENSIFNAYNYDKWVDFNFSLQEDDLDGGISGSVDLTVGSGICLTGFYPTFWVDSPWTVSSNGHLKQDLPLKDSLYYKFYNQIYQNAKKINTGTWNGIIPSGVPFQIELVTCEFGSNVGTNNVLNIIYSGYGNNDQNDVRINEAFYLGKIENTGIRGKGRIFIPENNIFSSIGRGNSRSSTKSFVKALSDSRQNIFIKFSYILKNYSSFVLHFNYKLKRFLKFQQKQGKNINPSFYTPNNYTLCKNNPFINKFPSYIKVTRVKSGSTNPIYPPPIESPGGDLLRIEYLPNGLLYNSSRLDLTFAFGDSENNITPGLGGHNWNLIRMVKHGRSPNWTAFVWVPPNPDNSTTRSVANLSPIGAKYINFSIRSTLGSNVKRAYKYDFTYSLISGSSSSSL